MSSRFPPAHDSRYAPRTRSRSPPRYQEWRPSGHPNPAFPNRHGDFNRGLDPPRGPKTFNDTPRGPAVGPGTGPSAPLGPRGRGGPPRTEFRELRDAPPLGTDRSFREREFDRRPRPPSPRMRSPVRNFRDGPPPVRDLDIGRGRRDSRDGPINAGSNYVDTPAFAGPSTFGRGGFNGRGRGRGRGNFDFRERDRRPPTDDRNTFRPRDRSPPTRWGSISRPDRDDWRPERRDDDRWHDRDEREREPDRFRRDTASTRFDSRPPTPHQQAPLAQPPPERAPAFDTSRDEIGLRRPSAISLSANKEPPRRDALPPQPPPPMPLPPNDLLAGRVESSAARYGSRASSPPPSAPQVPAFGSLSFKSQAYTGPTSNVWKASPESRAPNVPTAPVKQPVISSPAPKAAPTAPKAQLAAAPLAAPRAPRALEGGPSTVPRDPTLERAPSAPKARNSSAPQPPIPTAPWALRTDDRPVGQFSQVPTREGRSLSGSFPTNAGNIPTSPRGSVLPPPVTRSYDQVVPQDRDQVPSAAEGGPRDGKQIRPDMAPPRLGTPPPSAPSGPRNAQLFNTSPVLPSPNVPTAPKAIRGPPNAPRAAADRGPPPHRPVDRPGMAPSRAPLNAPRAPAWNQWIRPGAPVYREQLVPVKRDAAGEERNPQIAAHASPTQNIVRQISDPAANRDDGVRDDRMLKTAPASPDRRNLDGSNILKSEQPENIPDSNANEEKEHPRADDMSDTEMKTNESLASLSDEEGMDLDEEDFAQSKAKFERQKAHLEAQMIDLSARQYRATTPLERIAKLARITVHDLPGPEVPVPEESKDVGAQARPDSHPTVTPTVLSTPPRMQEDVEPKAITPKQEQIEESEELATAPMEDVHSSKEIHESAKTVNEDDIEDVVMEGSDALDAIMPQPKPRIEAISLPYLVKAPLTPLSEMGIFQETTARHIALKPTLVDHFQAQADEDSYSRQELHDKYVENYRDWRVQTQLLDHERADKEPAERQMSVELGLDFDSSSVIAETSVSESRSRLHKYNSEYDFQKVLKESEETARLEQEKLERESRRAQIDLEKEAVIPDAWDKPSREKRMFKNMNRYRDPICLIEIYGYEPAVDTFTEAEHKRFLELFKDRPKKWGEIAEQLSGRSYADCIHHYYKYKWDGRFKEGKSKRRGKGGRGRGGKAGVSRARAPLMADLSKNEEDGSRSPMLTETGRPRRAATRTVYTAAETEAKTSSSTAVPAKKGPPSGENSTEKPVKRRKTTATGEKVPKRSRQNIVSTTTTSPAGNDRDLVPSKEDLARAQSLEDASLLAGLQAGHRNVSNSQPNDYAHEVFPVQHQVVAETAERSRTTAQPPVQRSSASSYWSVPEQTDFVKFIAHFGTDFGGIANHMGTKTQTMVKNYYQRLVESGNRPDVVEAAYSANARRERGEDMGVPPTPTPINKRRYDNPGPALPRTVSGSQGEVMDIDPVPPTQPSTTQTPSSQFQHQYRFSMSNQPTPMQSQRAGPPPLQANVSPALGKSSLPAQARQNPPSGPKMGFFSESRLDRRPPMQTQERPPPQQQQQQQQQQQSPSLLQQNATPPALAHQNLSHLTSEFVKNLKEEQERALSIQKRASQEHVPQVTSHHPLYQPLATHAPVSVASPQPSMLDRAVVEREERPGTPGVSNLGNPRSGPAMFRNILGSPAPLASPPVSMQPPFRSTHVPSPPKREDYRPGSVPAPSPAPSVAKPAMSLAATPAPEPRKTSNLASLLNSEPEEPRSKKRVAEQPLPSFTQSPTVSTLNAAPSSSSTPLFPPRREVFNQTPIPRSDFDSRSAYPQPATHAPTPIAETLSGRAATPVGSRQAEWATRPPMTQGLTSSSPHPPTPLERDVRPYFSHRTANLGSLNSQSRHNPSPPPNAHPFLPHSRTPSLGGRPLTPTQMQPQSVTGLSHLGPAHASQAQAQSQIHHVNPHGHTIVPASHMQQIQAHQQSQMHHRQNSGGSAHSLHQRQPSRSDDMLRQQERDYHVKREYEQRMELERQQISRQQKDREAHYQAQAQQQEQQRYAQHRGSQGFPPQQLPGPPTGLSFREQARLEADQSYREEQFRRDRERFEHDREMYTRRAQQQEEEDRMRYEYRAPSGMMGRGFPPPPPPQHRRQG